MNSNAHQVIHSKKYLIIGLGKTGLSCAKFLVQQHVDVVVMDTREFPPGLSELQQDYPEVVVKTGGLDVKWLQQADMIVLSPGVDPRLPEVKAAIDAGIEIVGDIELFARFVNAPVVAVTGSNGKSTVTTLLAEMAEKAGKKIQVGGNLGTPVLDLITSPEPDFYILELSSFQLETVNSLNAFASVILNVSPDHLDRYDHIHQYQQAKARIFNGDGVMVINQDDAFVTELLEPKRNHIGFSLHASEGLDFGVTEDNGQLWLTEGQQKLLSVADMKIVGKHNIANALATLALGSAMALPMSAMLTALKEYAGLPHRCQFVLQNNGITWINDSKSTNVGACIAAIDGLAAARDIVLIAGGQAKDQDFSELQANIKSSVKAVVLIGEDANKINTILPANMPVSKVITLESAVRRAAEYAEQGDKVLLSPACASFDMFTGYVERGEQFMHLVREVMA